MNMETAAPFPAVIGQLTLVDLLLLLAPIVIVPLGFRLVPLSGRRATRVLRFARRLQPLGALAAIVAFLLTPGWTAGLVALAWLGVCAVASLAGLMELVERRSLWPRQLVPAAALGYLSVGAGWLAISRAGLRPLGFTPAIVELTGVHFHYAGFGATLIAGLTLMALHQRPRAGRLTASSALLVAAGTPITAVAITTGSAPLTILGPVALTSGILATAGLIWFCLIPMVGSAAGRWLLRISTLSVVAPMGLAVDYAAGRVFGLPALDLQGMAALHGTLNALGFTLAGLLGWTFVTDPGSVISREMSRMSHH